MEYHVILYVCQSRLPVSCFESNARITRHHQIKYNTTIIFPSFVSSQFLINTWELVVTTKPSTSTI